jgi:transposase
LANAVGRPSKLTPELQKKLVDAIKAGNYFETACGFCGIDYSTFRKWMVKGEKAKSGVYFDFFHAIKKAEAQAEYRMVALWQQAIPEDWRSAKDFLERRYPERWGRKEQLKADVKNHNTNVEIDLNQFSTEELRKIAGFESVDN